ncbi:LppA family lipoprotein [Amycolatopsis antarctica]|uniref:LppA family lipoprotein n=1 Tax=Amycolatopsis antarctica TaxID=1854586 RepID=UPI0013FD5E1B|nr:LppA family lipoprotein [Amycolatopsis antarctica]
MIQQRTRPLAKLAVALACTSALAACGDNDADRYLNNDTSREDMSLQQQWDELMKRPNIDEAKTRHDEMLRKITEKLSTDLQLPPWQQSDEVSTNTGCNDFKEVDAWDAVNLLLGGSTNPVPISTDQWPQAIEVVKSVAGQHGFTAPGLEVNKGDYHELNISDSYGASLRIIAGAGEADGKKGTIVGINTGCHLLPESKQRGVPANGAQPGS